VREPHPVFDRQVEPDAPIWRYFDFAKFTSALQQSALYFSRADLLGDPLEGSFTRAYAAQRDEMIRSPPEGRTSAEQEAIFRHNERIFAATPRRVYVNCWHIGDHESMAMWRGYGGGAYGIAIRSTFARLDAAIPEFFKSESRGADPRAHVTFKGFWRDEPIQLGRVQYLDYSSLTERLPHEFNIYGRLICKSLPYRHENELRAMFVDPIVIHRTESDPPGVTTLVDGPAGFNVTVSMPELIESIIVSPLSPAWFQTSCDVFVKRMDSALRLRHRCPR
jgi:hypothetical protein